MSGIIHFSEAASLAIHAMVLLATERDRRLQIRDIAQALPVSSNHLAKVLQRLTKQGLIESVRGRGGGFALAREPAKVTLLEVYEAVEGPLQVSHCMFSTPHCQGDCLLGDTLCKAGSLIRDRLAGSHLSELTALLQRRLGRPAATARRARRSSRGG